MKLKHLLMITFLVLLPTTSHAVNLGFLKYSLIGRLSAKEVESFGNTVQGALKAAPDQETIIWQSDESEMKGRLKVRYSYEMDSRACRHMVFELKDKDNQRELFNIDFCQQDGNWMLMSTPTSRFSTEDWSSLEMALQDGLDNAEDGQRRQWVSPKGNFSADLGLDSIQNHDGSICRSARITVTDKEGGYSKGDYVFCKTDGTWKRDATREIQ